MNAVTTPDRSSLIKYFDALAPERVRWVEKNRYYHEQLEKTFSFYIPPNRSVLEIGSGAGQLLAALKPARGVGIDLSPKMVQVAKERYPHLEFCKWTTWRRFRSTRNSTTSWSLTCSVSSMMCSAVWRICAAFARRARAS
jgi:SAM-dependent methyltransferase